MAGISGQTSEAPEQQVAAGTATPDAKAQEQAALASAEANLQYHVSRISEDYSIPANIRAQLVASLQGLSGKNLTAAEIEQAVSNAEAIASGARTTATSDAAEQHAEAVHMAIASMQVSGEDHIRIHSFAHEQLDIHSAKSVDAYARNIVALEDVPVQERAAVVDATKRMLADPERQAENATINAETPEQREAFLTEQKQKQLYLKKVEHDDEYAPVRNDVIAAETVGVDASDIADDVEGMKHGAVTIDQAKASLNKKYVAHTDAAGADIKKDAKFVSTEAVNATKNLTNSQVVEKAVQARVKQASGQQLTHSDDVMLEVWHTAQIGWDRTKEATQKAVQQAAELAAAQSAVYSFDTGKLNESPDARLNEAVAALKRDSNKYSHLDENALRAAAQIGLMNAQNTRNDIRNNQRDAIVALAANTDAAIPDESDTNRASRIARIEAALEKSKLPNDHLSQADKDAAIQKALAEAQRRRNDESYREQLAVIKEATKVDVAVTDIEDTSPASRIARIQKALEQDHVATKFIHQSDLNAAIQAGMEKAKERRAETKAQHLSKIDSKIVDVADETKANGLSAEARIQHIVDAYHAEHDTKKMGLGWKNTPNGAGYNDISDTDLRKEVVKELATIDTNNGKLATENGIRMKHLAELASSGATLHAAAKSAGAQAAKNVAAVFNTKDHTIANTVGAVTEAAYTLNGTIQLTLADFNFGQKVHLTPENVHDEVRDILKDPKALAALVKDLKASGIDPERLHLTGNTEQDIANVQTLLQKANVNLATIVMADAKKGDAHDGKINEKDLAEAVTAAFKAGASVPVTVASATHTAATATAAAAAQKPGAPTRQA